MIYTTFQSRHAFAICRRMSFLLVTLLLCSTTALAQELKINGVVTSSSTGEELIGVSILVKGTGKGVVTGVDGSYSLTANPGQELEFSYVGYKNKSVTVRKSGRLDVELTEDAQMLDQVVVVGYGTMKRSDLTGSVASISEEQIKQGVNTSIEQAMQGRIAGVQVMQNSGAPGGGISGRFVVSTH